MISQRPVSMALAPNIARRHSRTIASTIVLKIRGEKEPHWVTPHFTLKGLPYQHLLDMPVQRGPPKNNQPEYLWSHAVHLQNLEAAPAVHFILCLAEVNKDPIQRHPLDVGELLCRFYLGYCCPYASTRYKAM